MKAAISSKKLEQILHVRTATIKMYLCRQGLRHIKFIKGIFYNISEEDIETLRNLIRYKSGYKKRQELGTLTNNELQKFQEETKKEIENKESLLRKILDEIEKRKATKWTVTNK